MSYDYAAYGLNIHSDIPLPGFGEGVAANAPEVRFRADGSWRQDRGETASGVLWYSSPYSDDQGRPVVEVRKSRDCGSFQFLFCDGTDFTVDCHGERTQARWPDCVSTADVAEYLSGPILGFALRLRGATCLHASAVEIGGRAILFAGRSGAGKSTLAAALAQQGHPVITEDVAALTWKNGKTWVEFGCPRINLWPDSAGLLVETPEALPRIAPGWEKRYLDPTTGVAKFHWDSAPLGGIFVLGERSEDAGAPILNDLSPREALLAVVTNTYLNQLPDVRWRARDLEFLSRVVASVPVRRLTPHKDPGRLGDLCKRIMEISQ